MLSKKIKVKFPKRDLYFAVSFKGKESYVEISGPVGKVYKLYDHDGTSYNENTYIFPVSIETPLHN